MAAIAPTVDIRIQPDDMSIVKSTWNNLNQTNNVGNSVALVQHSDRCVEVRGNFDGATIVMEGSNGGTVFSALTTPAGTAVSFTANGIKQITEAPLFMRPNITVNANANTLLTADLLLRRNTPLVR